MYRLPTRALVLALALGSSQWCAAQQVVSIPDAPCEGQGCGAPCGDSSCGGCGASCGCAKCCAPVCKSCVVVPDVVKHPHTHYKCKCADFCLTKRLLSDLFHFRGKSCGCCETSGACGGEGCCQSGCCHSCPPATCPHCECKVRQKMVLLKRIVVQECPSFKCEPVCCPSCGGCGQGCDGACQGEVLEGGLQPFNGEAPLPGLEQKKPVPVPPSASRRRFGRS